MKVDQLLTDLRRLVTSTRANHAKTGVAGMAEALAGMFALLDQELSKGHPLPVEWQVPPREIDGFVWDAKVGLYRCAHGVLSDCFCPNCNKVITAAGWTLKRREHPKVGQAILFVENGTICKGRWCGNDLAIDCTSDTVDDDRVTLWMPVPTVPRHE